VKNGKPGPLAHGVHPKARFFVNRVIDRLELQRNPRGMKAAFDEALREWKRELVDAGALENTISVYRAWDGVDGLAVSIEYQLPPDARVLPEWPPIALPYTATWLRAWGL
jgi:hypothetical protein